MKKIFLLIIAIFSNAVISQNLPQLNLGNFEDVSLEQFGVKLDKDEICVILKTNIGSTAYDESIYYIFKQNGQVDAFKERTPKKYIQNAELKTTREILNLDTKNAINLFECLNSKVTLDFLNYSQSDFILEHTVNREKYILDKHAKEYSITFFQNDNSKSYMSYEPRQQFRTDDPRINKIVLGKFISLLELWGLLKV